MHVLKSLGHRNLQLLLGMRSSNKHYLLSLLFQGNYLKPYTILITTELWDVYRRPKANHVITCTII